MSGGGGGYLVPRSRYRNANPARARQLGNLGRYAFGAAGTYIPRAINRAYQAYADYGGTPMGPTAKEFKKQASVNKQIRKYRQPKKVYRAVSGLKKQVKELRRVAESDMGTHVARLRNTARVVAGVNGMGQASFDLNTTTLIEAELANLRYYNPSDPATLVTAAGATGTFQKEFYVKRSFSKATAVNNYQVPALVTMYMCTPREDTSTNPQTAFTSGLTDVGNPTATSPLVYLTDSILFKDLWNIASSKKRLLQPGEALTISHSSKPYQYDPSLVDVHALLFQNRYGGLSCVIRCEGTLAHDTSASEQGFTNVTVDVSCDHTWEILYAAGADIHTVNITNSSNTFTNAGVVSNKPVSDNQSFSTS